MLILFFSIKKRKLGDGAKSAGGKRKKTDEYKFSDEDGDEEKDEGQEDDDKKVEGDRFLLFNSICIMVLIKRRPQTKLLCPVLYCGLQT